MIHDFLHFFFMQNKVAVLVGVVMLMIAILLASQKFGGFDANALMGALGRFPLFNSPAPVSEQPATSPIPTTPTIQYKRYCYKDPSDSSECKRPGKFDVCSDTTVGDNLISFSDEVFDGYMACMEGYEPSTSTTGFAPATGTPSPGTMAVPLH